MTTVNQAVLVRIVKLVSSLHFVEAVSRMCCQCVSRKSSSIHNRPAEIVTNSTAFCPKVHTDRLLTVNSVNNLPRDDLSRSTCGVVYFATVLWLTLFFPFTACDSGDHGINCMERCSEGCQDLCDATTGVCDCKPWWDGNTCTVEIGASINIYVTVY